MAPALFAMLFAVACLPAKPSTVPDPAALQAVRTVYLGSFGSSKEAEEARERLRADMFTRGRLMPVELASEADAILQGSVGLSTTYSNGNSDFAPFGVLRLTNRRTGALLWLHQYSERRLIAAPTSTPQGMMSLLVNQMSERLHTAVAGPAPR